MSLEHLLRDEEEALNFFLEEAERQGEFEMQETIRIRYHEEDKPIHTKINPFCSDWTCPCHADIEAINKITSFVMDGLLSWHEANTGGHHERFQPQ